MDFLQCVQTLVCLEERTFTLHADASLSTFFLQSTTVHVKHHDAHEKDKPLSSAAAAKAKAFKVFGIVKQIARVDQRQADMALVKWLVCNYHPLRTTEEPDFKAFCKELNASYEPPAVETVKERISRLNRACNLKVRSFQLTVPL
jgi:hypothetical protein